MNTQKVDFIKSAANKKAFLRDGRHAVAFAGRSTSANLRSSTVCSTGKTTPVSARRRERRCRSTILVDGTYFIDLPGYGYARVSGDERRRWGALMEDFFQEPNLFTMGVLIVDSRHAPTADDVTMAEYFFAAGRPFVVVANKCDKLKKSEIEPNLERIRDVLGLDDDFPLLLYSCTAKVGRRELLGFIENNI